MNKRLNALLMATALFVFAGAAPAVAVWAPDGVPVCTEEEFQVDPAAVTDGSGGIIVAWTDYRNGIKIYVQRIDAYGNPLWASGGVPVCADTARQLDPSLVPTSDGGALIVWRDDRNGHVDLYAQRIDSNGNPLWSAGGVRVTSTPTAEVGLVVVTDGANGMILAWFEAPVPFGEIVLAQRIDASGDVLWDPDGLNLGGGDSVSSPSIAADGAGGVFVAFLQTITINTGVQVQHLDPGGALIFASSIWGALGQDIQIASDGTGGCFVVWAELDPVTITSDIVGHRLDSAGAAVWDTAATVICDAENLMSNPLMVSSDGGLIVAWMDFRNEIGGSGVDLYAQKVDADGTILWAADGVAVCQAMETQSQHRIIPDGADGAIIAWHDRRDGEWDLYAQRLRANGAVLWPAGGLPICTSEGDQIEMALVPAGAGTGIAGWMDRRNMNWDIYAGVVRYESPIARANLDIRPGACPNPFNPASRGKFTAAVLGDAGFDVRNIDAATVLLEGVSPIRWSFSDVAGPGDAGAVCGCPEAGPDGYDDLKMKFETREIAEAMPGASAGDVLVLTMTGTLMDGRVFEARDCVVIRGNAGENRPQKDNSGRLTLKSGSWETTQRIGIENAAASMVEISVYDVAGRLVRRVHGSVLPAGVHTIEWDSSGLSSGFYFYRVVNGAEVSARKFVLLR